MFPNIKKYYVGSCSYSKQYHVCKIKSKPPFLRICSPDQPADNTIQSLVSCIPVSISGWIKWHIPTAGHWSKKLACRPSERSAQRGRNGGSHFANRELLLKVCQAASSLDKSQTREVRLVISRADRSPPFSLTEISTVIDLQWFMR